MEFSFSPEQQLLAEAANQWGAEQARAGVARAAVAGKPVPLPELWSEMAHLGWLGVIVPEECGGSGGSLVDACLIVEALSRHLVPLPYAGNALVAVAGLRLFGGDPALLAELAAGTARYAVAVGEDLRWPPAKPTGIAWEWTEGDRILVLGESGFVPAEAADARPRPSVDFTRSLATVTGLPGPTPAGEAGEVFLAWARVATGAALVGAMDGSSRAAVEYAKGRQQFGRPIGSFQAVQHLCSEMLVDTEAARSALYGAAWAVEHAPPHEAAKAAAMAKAWCASAAVRVCETAMQVHGGMGMTWECDGHLYLRASHLAAAAFGGEAAALDAVADALFTERSPA